MIIIEYNTFLSIGFTDHRKNNETNATDPQGQATRSFTKVL